jgi:shikimate kinase
LNKRSTKTVDANVRPRARAKVAAQSSVPTPNVVFLIGFMGAGKTSVGRLLGERLNWLFEDLDDRIERRERRTVAQIFRESGEAAFRRAEHSALHELIEGLQAHCRIVALGGGAYVHSNNAALLKSSGLPIIFLDAPVEDLWDRCCQEAGEAGSQRPLLRDPDHFRQLYETRRRTYAEVPITIQTSGRTLCEIAAEIEQKLGLKKIETHVEQGEVE